MKKVALLLIALVAIIVSCQKTVKVPVSYTVENAQGTPPSDIFVPDSGTYDLAAWVKFLTGTNEDKVTVILKGLPSDVTVEKDTISDYPTFVAHFILHTSHAVRTVHPVSIVATARGSEPKTYNFNMTVIPADCAAGLLGNYNGANSCTLRNYAYTATATQSGSINEFYINNFGGYGTSTNMKVLINCNNDSLTVPNQNIGNGTVLQGYGTFVGNKITIWYTASSTPLGFGETCSAVLTKQ